jgi:anti-sigma B factor antagonist
MPVEVQPSPSGRVVVVRLVGEHDISTAPEVRRALNAASSAPLVVLDLGPTTFLDSTILGVFVAAWKRVRVRGGRITAVNAHHQVAQVLSITKLDTMLVLSGTQDSPLDEELRALLGPTEVL